MNIFSSDRLTSPDILLTSGGNGIAVNGSLWTHSAFAIHDTGANQKCLQFDNLVNLLIQDPSNTNRNISVYTAQINQFNLVNCTLSGNVTYSGNRVVTGVSNIGIGSGIYSGSSIGNLQFKTLIGGSGVRITGNPANNTLYLEVTGIVGGAAAGVTSLGVTGTTSNGDIIFSGLGSITLTRTGQYIFISGSGGGAGAAASYDVPTARYFV